MTMGFRGLPQLAKRAPRLHSSIPPSRRSTSTISQLQLQQQRAKFHNYFNRRRRVASVAAILTVTSATALAAMPPLSPSSSSSSSSSGNSPDSGSARTNEHTRHSFVNGNATAAVSTTLNRTDCQGQAAAAATKDDDKDNNNDNNTNPFEMGNPTKGTTLLPASLLKYDHYNGVIVHLDWIFHHPDQEERTDPERQQHLEQLYQEWSIHPEKFESILRESLQEWKFEGRKGIWIHLPRQMSFVVPACIKLGFDFHSCQNHDRINAATTEQGSTTLILSQWLPTDTVSRLPLGPYFQAGVGCVVLHPKDCRKMLVVQEITGPAAARNLWKMPTGLIDPGEDIAEAAVRELEEETGLKGATCQGILSFRQAHGVSAGRASSDLFFVCLLTLPPDIAEQQSTTVLDNLKPQEHEIADIRWMTVEDYANQEIWQKSPVYQELNQAIIDASENQQHSKPIPLVVPQKLQVGWLAGTNTVYRSKL